jgi:hypothetical protein
VPRSRVKSRRSGTGDLAPRRSSHNAEYVCGAGRIPAGRVAGRPGGGAPVRGHACKRATRGGLTAPSLWPGRGPLFRHRPCTPVHRPGRDPVRDTGRIHGRAPAGTPGPPAQWVP